MDKYCEESIINERQNRINLIVNIDKDYYEIIKYNVEHGQDYKLFKIIANGKLYEERLQGEWIFLKANEEQTDGYECSVCKCAYHTRVPYFSEYNFCPNCGAKMKGGAE